MPRDSRLYMTFPIDFWTHPKVSRLSDAAFRAFVESNGHSRMRETGGVLEPEPNRRQLEMCGNYTPDWRLTAGSPHGYPQARTSKSWAPGTLRERDGPYGAPTPGRL